MGKNILGQSRKHVSKQMVRYIRMRDNDTCQLCQRVYNPTLAKSHIWMYFDTIEIDHIVPFSFGGRNEVSNYQLCCMECNRRKGNTVVE